MKTWKCSTGPMVELDGKRRAPGFFQEYLVGIVLTTILAPVIGLSLLIKDGDTDLGLSTLGVYLLCLFVQIATESITLRTGSHQGHPCVCTRPGAFLSNPRAAWHSLFL